MRRPTPAERPPAEASRATGGSLAITFAGLSETVAVWVLLATVVGFGIGVGDAGALGVLLESIGMDKIVLAMYGARRRQATATGASDFQQSRVRGPRDFVERCRWYGTCSS